MGNYFGRRHNLASHVRLDRKAIVRLHIEALPALAIPVLILGGIYSGIVTVTEAAALGAMLSMCVGLFIYRDIAWTSLLRLLTESVTNTARIMFIVAMSFAFSHWIIASQVSQSLLESVMGSDISVWKFLLMMNIVMLFLGIFLEVISVILITLPLVLPVILALGIDPIHYAIIVIVNMQIATITPPGRPDAVCPFNYH